MNIENYIFQTPRNFKQIVIKLSFDAIEWLNGTTTTHEGVSIINRTLFYDILSRMRFCDSVDGLFRRPQQVLAGQAQLSEVLIAKQWRMGRKQVHNIRDKMIELELLAINRSKVASVASYICIQSWSTDSSPVTNPFYEVKQSR